MDIRVVCWTHPSRTKPIDFKPSFRRASKRHRFSGRCSLPGQRKAGLAQDSWPQRRPWSPCVAWQVQAFEIAEKYGVDTQPQSPDNGHTLVCAELGQVSDLGTKGQRRRSCLPSERNVKFQIQWKKLTRLQCGQAFCFLRRFGASRTNAMLSSELIVTEAPSLWILWPMIPQSTSPTFSSSIMHCFKLMTLEWAVAVRLFYCLLTAGLHSFPSTIWSPDTLFKQVIALIWSGDPRGDSRITQESAEKFTPNHRPCKSCITSGSGSYKLNRAKPNWGKNLRINWKDLGKTFSHRPTSVRSVMAEVMYCWLQATSTASLCFTKSPLPKLKISAWPSAMVSFSAEMKRASLLSRYVRLNLPQGRVNLRSCSAEPWNLEKQNWKSKTLGENMCKSPKLQNYNYISR